MLIFCCIEHLALSSLRVHLVAVSAFHPPIQGKLVFLIFMMLWFFKGIIHLFPPMKEMVPRSDLNMVPGALIGLSTVTCLWVLLSQNMAFLVAVTSARRDSKLQALIADPRYTQFFKDKVALRPLPIFLSKVVSQFHFNQVIYLHIFFPKPHSSTEEQCLHSLDVKQFISILFRKKQTISFITSTLCPMLSE